MIAGDYFIRRVLTAIHGPYAYSRVILPFFLRFWCNVRVFLNTVFSFFLWFYYFYIYLLHCTHNIYCTKSEN